MEITRRDFLSKTLLASGTLLVGLEATARHISTNAAYQPYPGGKLLQILPFSGEMDRPMGRIVDIEASGNLLESTSPSGLDSRLFTDLTNLSPDSLIVPNDRFYIRTTCPDLIDYSAPWTIKVTQAANESMTVPIETVTSMSRDRGVHLMECSGNGRAGHFGLLSTCAWDGVPVLQLLDSLKVHPGSKRILISGFDRHSQRSRSSSPGASWIFTLEQLEKSGAFLATRMNGTTLPRDHGYPVRLIVPGWYGCVCSKWVNEISIVGDDAQATAQMREFAGRTHQDGVPKLARDYCPATIDQAAMPVRVEQWLVEGHIKYNVVGIMWGGDRPTRDLQIRFLPDQVFVPVETYHHATNHTWTLWSHKWAPAEPGLYRIQLQVADRSIRTRRSDKGYYMRSVNIAQI